VRFTVGFVAGVVVTVLGLVAVVWRTLGTRDPYGSSWVEAL
jgi:hypothetical protein